MDKSPEDKKEPVEKLKDSLYSRKNAPVINADIRTPLQENDIERPQVAWEDTKLEPDPPPAPTRRRRVSFASLFFIGSILFFVIAAAIAAYMVFFGGGAITPQNIDIQVVASSIIDGGKEANFQIIITNRNKAPLQLADLSIQYPDGTRSPQDQTQPLTSERQSIGTILPGQQVRRTASAVFFGQEGSSETVKVTLDYSVQGSNSIFEKESDATFTIGSAPVSVAVNSPQQAIAGQPFTMDVNVTNNSAQPIPAVVLEAQYPYGFTLTSTNPTAAPGGTYWHIGDLNPGESKVVQITGSLDGQDGDQRVFRFLTGSDSDPTDTTIQTPFMIMPQTVTVTQPFITAVISLNGQTGNTVSVDGNQNISGTIQWKNNLSTPVSNVEMHLAFSGQPLDTSSISSNEGFFQSQDNTITWTKDTNPELANVPPGASGTFTFNFKALPANGKTAYTNPNVDLNLSVSGDQTSQSGSPEQVTTDAALTAQVASQVVLGVEALHFEGPFTNYGPMPPVAESPTSYTVTWTVTNSSNTIANATVSTVLPPYITFVTADSQSGIRYDKTSRTVSWSLGDLQSGVGFALPARTGSFQVTLLPSDSQVNYTPQLTGDTTLTGQDRYAQLPVNVVVPGPSTVLNSDPQFQAGMGTVLPKQQ